MSPRRAFARRHILGALRLALIPAAGLLAACDPAALGTSSRPGQVNVALLLPSGGSDAQLEVIADSLLKAAQMALEESPEGVVTLRSYATGADQVGAVEAAKRAVAEGADVILGPLFAQNAAAVGTTVLPRTSRSCRFPTHRCRRKQRVPAQQHLRQYRRPAGQLCPRARQEPRLRHQRPVSCRGSPA